MRPPIVYLGPSLPLPEAAAILPGADFRPPVRRGDLYRDREQGAGLFLILDGVFFQQQAVPPREICDVVADGALVTGAASMGALRAAECWPVGMRGIGSIYRLFRRGRLLSDDEVAVAFDPAEGRSLSVPLVNVRYALSRAVREGLVDRPAAARIAGVAGELFYTERSWEEILARSGQADRGDGLVASLARHDLKKRDATRALATVRRWLAADPGLASRPRLHPDPFVPSERHRERPHDALMGAAPGEIRRPFARWLLLSGRYARYLPALALAHPELGAREILGNKRLAASILARKLGEPDGWGEGEEVGAFGRQAAWHLTLMELRAVATAREESFAEAVWAELTLSGELDAELFRWRAVREAVTQARQLNLEARPWDRHLAESEIAYAQGYRSWQELREAAATTAYPWALFVEYRDDLALAKRLRERLFEKRPRMVTV